MTTDANNAWKDINTAPQDKRVLLYREDSKTVEIGRVDPRYLGNPEYAYTHWMPIPETPKKYVLNV